MPTPTHIVPGNPAALVVIPLASLDPLPAVALSVHEGAADALVHQGLHQLGLARLAGLLGKGHLKKNPSG